MTQRLLLCISEMGLMVGVLLGCSEKTQSTTPQSDTGNTAGLAGTEARVAGSGGDHAGSGNNGGGRAQIAGEAGERPVDAGGNVGAGAIGESGGAAVSGAAGSESVGAPGSGGAGFAGRNGTGPTESGIGGAPGTPRAGPGGAGATGAAAGAAGYGGTDGHTRQADGFTCHEVSCGPGERCLQCFDGTQYRLSCVPNPNLHPADYAAATSTCVTVSDHYQDCDGPEDCPVGQYCVTSSLPTDSGGATVTRCQDAPHSRDRIFCCYACNSTPECTLCRTNSDCPTGQHCARTDAPGDAGGCAVD